MDVVPHSRIRIRVEDPNFRKPFLPERSSYSQFLSSPKCKSTFDELNCTLDADFASDSEQQMEVVRHNHEFMQPELSLRTIFVKNSYEQSGATIRLEKIAFLVGGRSNEESTCVRDYACGI